MYLQPQDEEIVCDSIPAALSPAVQPTVPEILDPLPLESNLPPVPLQDVDMPSSAEDAVQLRIESSTYVQTGRRSTRDGVEESAQVQMDEAHNGVHSAEGSTATPIAEKSTVSPQSRSSSPQIPPCIVPGFWFASVGKPHPDVLDFEFVVDAESAGAALHWGGRNVTFECVTFLLPPLLLLQNCWNFSFIFTNKMKKVSRQKI